MRGRDDPSGQPAAIVVRTARWRQISFVVLGVVAAVLRGLTWPWRRALSPCRTVLILEPFGMGDVLSLDPLIRMLLADGWSVRVAGQARWRDVLAAHPQLSWISTTLPWRGEGQGAHRTFARLADPAFRLTLQRLRPAARGAIGLDPRGDIRSVALLYLSGCRRVATFARYYVAADCRVLPGSARRVLPPSGLPRWRVNLCLLSALNDTPHTALSATARPSVAHLAAGPDPPAETGLLVLIPMTPWSGKRWPAEHWRAFLAGACRRGWKPLGCCGPGEAEATAGQLGRDVPVCVCDGPGAWVDVLRRAQCVICVNTGPMHVADALDKPLVLLNGSSQLPLWGPSGRQARVLQPPAAGQSGAASFHEVPGNQARAQAAMAAILPETVLQALGDPAIGTGQDAPSLT